MSQSHQGSHSTTEAEQMQRVERLLHGTASWEPSTPPPADLCARVADRIAGRSPRLIKRKTRLSLVSYGFIASGACAAIALAVVLPGRLAPPSEASTTVPVATWTPPRLSGTSKIGVGNNYMALATYHETQPEPIQTTEATPVIAERKLVSPHRRPHLPRKRAYPIYATRTGHNASVSPTPQASPKTLAEGPYPEEWGPQDDMVALVPVVLADYEPDPNGDGSPESMQTTYTPAVVAISLKEDALGESPSRPLPQPESSTQTPAPAVTPTPDASPTPESAPGATGESK